MDFAGFSFHDQAPGSVTMADQLSGFSQLFSGPAVFRNRRLKLRHQNDEAGKQCQNCQKNQGKSPGCPQKGSVAEKVNPPGQRGSVRRLQIQGQGGF